MLQSSKSYYALQAGVICLFLVSGFFILSYFQDREATALRAATTGLSNTTMTNADRLQEDLNAAQRIVQAVARSDSLETHLDLARAPQPDQQPSDTSGLPLPPSAAPAERSEPASARGGFLRTYLTSEALKHPLLSPTLPDGFQASLSVTQTGGGIVVLDADGNWLAGSTGAPVNPATSGDLAAQRPVDDNGLVIAQIDRRSFLLVTAPIALQSNGEGLVVGLVPLSRMADAFFELTAGGPGPQKRSILLRMTNDGTAVVADSARLLSGPIQEGVMSNAAFDGARAEPGTVVEGDSFEGSQVVSLFSPIGPSPLGLYAEMDQEAALGQLPLVKALSLSLWGIVGFSGMLALAYVRRRDASGASERDLLSERLRVMEHSAENDTLRLILDSVDEPIVLVDASNSIVFANQRYRSLTQGSSTGAQGNGESSSRALTHEPHIDHKFAEKTIRLPGRRQEGQLFIGQDSDVKRPTHSSNMDLVDDILFSIVDELDARDKHASHHSRRVNELAERLALKLEMDAETATMVGLAGRLLNLGKLRAEPNLMQSAKNITDDERAALRQDMSAVAEIVGGYVKNHPIIPMLRQAFERPDGTGHPNGLMGDQINLPGRVLAVANAFVALTSARPHREPLTASDAVAQLEQEVPDKYDRRVVAALRLIVDESPATPVPALADT